ncbi:substrate-binding domain-containing protein [Mycobacterium vicinigordonae]|uniref:Substrate-binding domain-containing protein n=1 Tax=Mycobacterium vicinigordonae TaxID=1719132 RepID=A0A7D6HLE5_9MYCO|nr:substrate-binding domain-containing protein [Mycobacterium vicinigordonae]QLL05151.1 substrate-binding domain-containing protein [Mycobacterium vicinigordonae]
MGRHSKPDPDDSLPEDEPYDQSSQYQEHGGEAGTGEGVEPAEALDYGYPGPAGDEYPAPSRYTDDDFFAAEDSFTDRGEDLSQYPVGGEYAAADGDDYPDFGTRPESTESPVPAAATPASRLSAAHRGLASWQGGHRSTSGRRGVSIGVIVALITVIVVVAGVILWRFFGGSHDAQSASARCLAGKDSVAVLADPTIVDVVKQLAEDYNAQAGPIGDRCVPVTVKSAGADAVISGFIGKWPADLGNQPGLWIPGSSISAARLAGAVGPKTISDSRSLVTSPVLLAIRPEFQPVLAKQDWAALPGLQTNPTSMAGLNQPSWGSLRLAMPITGNGDASYLAGEAIAAASVPAGAPPTDGGGAARTLMSAQPKLSDDSLNEAFNALLKPGAKADEVAAAPVHAVVTTEQQLYQRGQSTPDAKSKLTSWTPPGPVPVADYPTVLLSGTWLSQEQTTAASAFSRFMRTPEQQARLAKAGFRAKDVKPPSSPVTSFGPLSATLSVGDDATRATLADTMATSSSGVAATIMLDQSLPTDDGGGKTRLANVVAALSSRIKALPPTAVIGLWTFDGHEGRSEVAAGPLADQLNGQPRTAALTAALDRQYSSGGGAVSFTTLRMIYQEMKTNYHAGQANSILVITGGPHTDQSLDGPGLQEFIRTAADPAKPIAVNIIDFGGDPDRATWEAVAKLSGGSYQNLPSSATPALASAVNDFLS